MIYGIGTDLCDVGRIEKSIARPAFLQHVYTPAEQELIVAHTGKKQAETAAATAGGKGGRRNPPRPTLLQKKHF